MSIPLSEALERVPEVRMHLTEAAWLLAQDVAGHQLPAGQAGTALRYFGVTCDEINRILVETVEQGSVPSLAERTAAAMLEKRRVA